MSRIVGVGTNPTIKDIDSKDFEKLISKNDELEEKLAKANESISTLKKDKEKVDKELARANEKINTLKAKNSASKEKSKDLEPKPKDPSSNDENPEVNDSSKKTEKDE